MIRNGDYSTYEYGVIVDIKQVLSNKSTFKSKHILKEANQCADVLTKTSTRGLFQLCLWENPPSSLSLLLLANYTSSVFVKPKALFCVSSVVPKKITFIR